MANSGASSTYVLATAQFKRRIFRMPNQVLISLDKESCSLILDSAREKFDIWIGPKRQPRAIWGSEIVFLRLGLDERSSVI